jgi:hypothetical protein
VYCVDFVRREFLNQQARGQATRIVIRRNRTGVEPRCDQHVARSRSMRYRRAAVTQLDNVIKNALPFLHWQGNHVQ